MSLPTEQWPVYIQAHASPQAAPERPPIPAAVLDMFTLRDPRSGQTERLVVLGCLGGGLLVVTEGDYGALDANLREQIQSARVSAREQFRTIVAADLTIGTLDAVEQRVQTRGLNDAVFVYGTLYARPTFAGVRLQVKPGAVNGRVTAGRPDVLHGCTLGMLHAFHSPLLEGERIGHVFLPVAPLDAVQQGQGLALLYPFLDPLKIQSADNSFILLRIIYDLLTHLQRDMRHEGTRHPFAQAPIFVPSRRQLEQELVADGYAIDGNTAFRQRPSPANGSASLLGRLRAMAHEWTAPRIALPPQATLEDYQQVIDSLLAALATPADLAMLRAVDACIAPPTTAARVPPVNSAGVPTTPLTSTMAITPPAAPAAVPRRNWSADFGSAASKPDGQDEAWWFATTPPQAETSGRDLFSKDDWLRDFLASAHVDTGSAPARKAQPPKAAWEDDFSVEPAEQAPPKQADWTNDFEPGE